jgi:hypothetical protein
MRLTMKKRAFITAACLMTLFVHLGLTPAFAAPTLKQITFDSPQPGEDRVTFTLNGAYLPKTFALKGERPRVIFDFPKVVPSKKIKNTMQVQGTFIKSIRTGIHKGDNPKTRIVFDLQPGLAVDFDQNFDEDTNALVIRLFAAGETAEPVAAEQTKTEVVQEDEAKSRKAVEEAVVEEATPETAAVESSVPQEAVQPEPEQPVEETVVVEPASVPETDTEKPAVVQEENDTVQETTDAEDTTVSDTESKVKSVLEESTVIQSLSEVGETEEKTEDNLVPTLLTVEFDDTSQRGEIVAFKLNTFNPPVVFGIEEDTPRIVCFFKDTSPGEELDEVIETQGRYIRNIQIGKYRNPDNVRVVLDLVPGKNYDLQQIFFKKDNLFMIIINTTGEKAAK